MREKGNTRSARPYSTGGAQWGRGARAVRPSGHAGQLGNSELSRLRVDVVLHGVATSGNGMNPACAARIGAGGRDQGDGAKVTVAMCSAIVPEAQVHAPQPAPARRQAKDIHEPPSSGRNHRVQSPAVTGQARSPIWRRGTGVSEQATHVSAIRKPGLPVPASSDTNPHDTRVRAQMPEVGRDVQPTHDLQWLPRVWPTGVRRNHPRLGSMVEIRPGLRFQHSRRLMAGTTDPTWRREPKSPRRGLRPDFRDSRMGRLRL